MNKAIKVKELQWNGDASVYMLTPSYEGNQYVVVSAVNNGFAHETYIFASDADGKVDDYSELPGSERGHTSHAQALLNAGYDVVEP